jgi:putative transposase
MKQWKRTSSIRIRQLLESTLINYGKHVSGQPVWQAGYYSFNLYSARKIEEKLLYMHQNPVRAGLAATACQWPWSSARYYEMGKSVGVKVGWID